MHDSWTKPSQSKILLWLAMRGGMYCKEQKKQPSWYVKPMKGCDCGVIRGTLPTRVLSQK